MTGVRDADPMAPRVYLGVQALQGPLWARHRGFPRYVGEHTSWLLRGHADLIAGIVLSGSLPTPRDLGELCGLGLVRDRSEEHTSELQSRSTISYAVSLDRKSVV